MRLATGMFAPIQIPSHSFRLSATQAMARPCFCVSQFVLCAIARDWCFTAVLSSTSRIRLHCTRVTDVCHG